MIDIDRRAFISYLGGASAMAALAPEAKADALEHCLQSARQARMKNMDEEIVFAWPGARPVAVTDACGAWFLERTDVRALRVGESDLRDPPSRDVAFLS